MRPPHPLLVALGVTASAAGVAAVALADTSTPPPLISITPTKTTATVSGADSLTAGQTTVRISAKAHRSIIVVRLKPGKTLANLKSAIKAAKMDASPVAKVSDFVGGGSSLGSGPYVFTTNMTAGDYAVIDDTQMPKVEAEFTVGAGDNGAAEPASGGTVTLKDFKITAPATLPANGAIKVTNDGPSPHFLIMGKLKKDSDGAKAVALFKMGADEKASKLFASGPGTGGELVDLITKGTSDVIAVTGLKSGKYMLACFYADAASHHKEHSMLGMLKVVTVK